jgi:predicted Zn finger-like uncharacterized protein
MIVSCPNCSTNFKVPEAALGRSVKCARCGHVWKAIASAVSAPAKRPAAPTPPAAKPAPAPRVPSPVPAPAFSAYEDEIPLESPPTRPVKSQPDTSFDHFPTDDPAMAEMNALGFTGEGGDPYQDEDEDDPFSKMSDLMQARQPESMPDIFSPPKPKKPLPRRQGAFILWGVLLILLLAGLALGLYFFQDKLIDHWPSLSKYYEQVGARRDEVGAGLSFRNYNSERLVQDNNEVLIVRGVIANGTEQKHDIPLLRLALYKGTEMLQEKVVSPPQASLDGKGTVGFKVTLEQPHPEATRFEVTFIAAKDAAK